MPSELTLLEFLELHIAQPAEWIAYKRVMNADLPKDAFAFFHFEKALESASEEARERVALERVFSDRARRELTSGRWSTTGRWINGGPYVELHRREWETGSISFRSNVLTRPGGGFGDLRLTPNHTSAIRSGPHPEKVKVRSVVEAWMQDYDKADRPRIKFKDALAQARDDLAPGVDPRAITENLFRELWQKFPAKRKLRGAPRKE